MTISELYSSVAKLGFEDTLEDDESFFHAANRAILQINALRPQRAVHIINHRPLPNAIGALGWSVVDVYERLTFEADDVKAFYFEASGRGKYVVELLEGGDWRFVTDGDFNSTGFSPVRGLVGRDGEFARGRYRLRFEGDYVYSLRHVALYQHLVGPDPEDIPAYEQFTRYDIEERTGDFLALSDVPIEVEGYNRMSCGYDIEDGRVLVLPYESRGIYKVTYNRRPEALVYRNEPLEDERRIDLDEDLCALMPLLVASFLCLDGEEGKAAHYLSLYQTEAVNIERRARSFAPMKYNNVTNW